MQEVDSDLRAPRDGAGEEEVRPYNKDGHDVKLNKLGDRLV